MAVPLLEPGRAGDAMAAAHLVYESDPPYYDYWLDNQQQALGTLAALWQHPAGAYSASENRVIVDQQGLAAVVSSYPAALEGALGAASDAALRAVCGGAAEHLLAREQVLAYLFPRLPDDAWYLRSLAVAADRRGQGVGAAIVAHLIEQARARGYRQMLVDVDSGNPGAVRFYAGLGFEILVETRVSQLLPHRLPASLRMAKLLNS